MHACIESICSRVVGGVRQLHCGQLTPEQFRAELSTTLDVPDRFAEGVCVCLYLHSVSPCARVRLCVPVCAYVYSFILCLRACMCADLRAHACLSSCVPGLLHVCLYVWPACCLCVSLCAPMPLCAGVCACVRACLCLRQCVIMHLCVYVCGGSHCCSHTQRWCVSRCGSPRWPRLLCLAFRSCWMKTRRIWPATRLARAPPAHAPSWSMCWRETDSALSCCREGGAHAQAAPPPRQRSLSRSLSLSRERIYTHTQTHTQSVTLFLSLSLTHSLACFCVSGGPACVTVRACTPTRRVSLYTREREIEYK
jgi:hypothetical protein